MASTDVQYNTTAPEKQASKEITMAETFILNTGQRKTIKSGFLKTSMVDMIYCGMPNENTFSIAMLLSSGYQGHGLNLFFPKKSTSIMLDKHKYYVLSVSPENITLQLSD